MKNDKYDLSGEITFWDAFYNTCKIDKKDGKPHLKEDLFAPFKDLWRLIYIFCGIVGGIMFPLMLSIHFQYFRNAKLHPKFYEPPVWQDYILVGSFGAAFLVVFLVLVIARVFLDKGAMRLAFISSIVILNAAQIWSPYAMGLNTFSFTLETLLTIVWLVISGCIETFLYSCGICMYAVGIVFLIQLIIAKVRYKKLSALKNNSCSE